MSGVSSRAQAGADIERGLVFMGRKPAVNSELGRRLTQVREAAGFKTRKELAATLEMNAETLGGYERGTSIPDHAFLKLYKDRFGISIDWLVTGEGEMSLSDVPRSPWEPLPLPAETGGGVLATLASAGAGLGFGDVAGGVALAVLFTAGLWVAYGTGLAMCGGCW